MAACRGVGDKWKRHHSDCKNSHKDSVFSFFFGGGEGGGIVTLYVSPLSVSA